MVRYSLLAAGLALGMMLGPVFTAAAQDNVESLYEEEGGPLPSPDTPPRKVENWGGLKPGLGREETFYACGPCHSEGRIKDKAMTRREWAQTLVWLSEEHNVPPLEADEQEIILDYLATHYGPVRLH